MDEARLTVGQAFPFDRGWLWPMPPRACPNCPAWAPKMQFLRGWASSALMAVSCISDPESGEVRLSHPNRPTASFRPDDPTDATGLIDWLRPLWPEVRPDLARVLHVPGQAITDQDDLWFRSTACCLWPIFRRKCGKTCRSIAFAAISG